MAPLAKDPTKTAESAMTEAIVESSESLVTLTATPGDRQMTLTWQAPALDGGSPITGYEYQGAAFAKAETRTRHNEVNMRPVQVDKENTMRRIGPSSRMRWLMLLLIFLAGYTAAGTAQEVDDAAIEINPLDYVPLAVGNRWTYEHYHWNNTYLQQGSWWDPDLAERLKPFVDVEIPGYPHGEGNALPPDSLLVPVDRILTIEITHTERVDGREYFVFSDAGYDWPPLPDFFWAGKKVRLSDEGFLVFQWNGQEVPIYDFGELQNGYTVTLPWESGTPVDVDRLVMFYEAPKTSSLHSLVYFRWETVGTSYCHFIRGYGMGLFVMNFFGLSAFLPLYENALTGISANIDGEEIWYDQLDPDAIPPDPEPPAVVWGQLAQLNRRSGFDFSAGTETDFYSENADIALDQWPAVGGDSSPDHPSFLCSHTCVGLPPAKSVDLGRVDFGRLVSEGRLPDLQPAQAQAQIHDPQVGHTYAIWTREGGMALMHVLKIILVGTRGRINFGGLVDYIFFD